MKLINNIKDQLFKHISNRMEDDGIRLQKEAKEKRELSEEEWIKEVNRFIDEINDRYTQLYCTD